MAGSAALSRTHIWSVSAPAKVGSIKFGWDQTAGNFNANYKIEGVAPYTLFGDGSNGTDYFPGTLTSGLHKLVATAFSSSGATGTNLGTRTVNFTVTGGTQQNNTVTSTQFGQLRLIQDNPPRTIFLDFRLVF